MKARWMAIIPLYFGTGLLFHIARGTALGHGLPLLNPSLDYFSIQFGDAGANCFPHTHFFVINCMIFFFLGGGVIVVLKITGIGQLLLKLSLVVGSYRCLLRHSVYRLELVAGWRVF